MTLSQGVMLGPFNFFSIRLVILTGLTCIFIRRDCRALPRSPLDRLMVVWSIWALVASAFHSDPGATLTFNGGIVFNAMGRLHHAAGVLPQFGRGGLPCRIVAWLLVPVAPAICSQSFTPR